MNATAVIYQPAETGHWKELFESKNKLLGAHNLRDGERLVAQIASVQVSEITSTNGKKEHVPVATFSGDIPPMVLNITNCKTIEALYGPYRQDWHGRKIVIFATEVKDFGGGKTTGLRIEQVNPDDVVTQAQVNAIRGVLKGIDNAEQGLCGYMQIERLEDLPAIRYDTALGAAKKKAESVR